MAYHGIFGALTFDLDNTLWETDISILRAEDAMVRHLRDLTPARWMADFNLDTFHAMRKEIVREQPQIAHNLTVIRKETGNLGLKTVAQQGL